MAFLVKALFYFRFAANPFQLNTLSTSYHEIKTISKPTAAAYKAAGIPAEHIYGEMDWKNRSSIIE
jgi:hypothetical protein